ncbi:hypothetical protein DNH61_12150 [Paenibacillus sambharensis]|uniref:Uncharacterized protein n=1 Tax=Paenibacillus sambharensis TaxID=1803190 RepID=A0A2W1L5B2_9BACL|nr:hypothetical protein [Paenibacillus sambharensis]PZD95298.1 hypothetical protein DNH61_12150 [Paenibacillus sambharensis]
MGMDHLAAQLLFQLNLVKEKPYLPHWGPIYGLLYEIRRLARLAKQDAAIYAISQQARVMYHYGKDQFAVEMPEMTIFLRDTELADALVSGSFYPLAEAGGSLGYRRN